MGELEASTARDGNGSDKDDDDDDDVGRGDTTKETAEPDPRDAYAGIGDAPGQDDVVDAGDDFVEELLYDARPSEAAVGAAMLAFFNQSATTAEAARDAFYRYGKNIVLESIGIFDLAFDSVEAKLRQSKIMDDVNTSVAKTVRSLVGALDIKRHGCERETVAWTLLDKAIEAHRVVSRASDRTDPRNFPCDSKTVPRVKPFGLERATPVTMDDACLLRFYMYDGPQCCIVDKYMGLIVRATFLASHPSSYILESEYFTVVAAKVLAIAVRDNPNLTVEDIGRAVREKAFSAEPSAAQMPGGGGSSRHHAIRDQRSYEQATAAAAAAAATTSAAAAGYKPAIATDIYVSREAVNEILNIIKARADDIFASLMHWAHDFCVYRDIMVALEQKINR
jgi:hypothetical protein